MCCTINMSCRGGTIVSVEGGIRHDGVVSRDGHFVGISVELGSANNSHHAQHHAAVVTGVVEMKTSKALQDAKIGHFVKYTDTGLASSGTTRDEESIGRMVEKGDRTVTVLLRSGR